MMSLSTTLHSFSRSAIRAAAEAEIRATERLRDLGGRIAKAQAKRAAEAAQAGGE